MRYSRIMAAGLLGMLLIVTSGGCKWNSNGLTLSVAPMSTLPADVGSACWFFAEVTNRRGLPIEGEGVTLTINKGRFEDADPESLQSIHGQTNSAGQILVGIICAEVATVTLTGQRDNGETENMEIDFMPEASLSAGDPVIKPGQSTILTVSFAQQIPTDMDILFKWSSKAEYGSINGGVGGDGVEVVETTDSFITYVADADTVGEDTIVVEVFLVKKKDRFLFASKSMLITVADSFEVDLTWHDCSYRSGEGTSFAAAEFELSAFFHWTPLEGINRYRLIFHKNGNDDGIMPWVPDYYPEEKRYYPYDDNEAIESYVDDSNDPQQTIYFFSYDPSASPNNPCWATQPMQLNDVYFLVIGRNKTFYDSDNWDPGAIAAEETTIRAQTHDYFDGWSATIIPLSN